MLGKRTVRFSGAYNGPPPVTLAVPLWERLGWGRGTVCYRGVALKFAAKLRYYLEHPPEWLESPEDKEAVRQLAEWLEWFRRVKWCRIHISFRK